MIFFVFRLVFIFTYSNDFNKSIEKKILIGFLNLWIWNCLIEDLKTFYQFYHDLLKCTQFNIKVLLFHEITIKLYMIIFLLIELLGKLQIR